MSRRWPGPASRSPDAVPSTTTCSSPMLGIVEQRDRVTGRRRSGRPARWPRRAASRNSVVEQVLGRGSARPTRNSSWAATHRQTMAIMVNAEVTDETAGSGVLLAAAARGATVRCAGAGAPSSPTVRRLGHDRHHQRRPPVNIARRAAETASATRPTQSSAGSRPPAVPELTSFVGGMSTGSGSSVGEADADAVALGSAFFRLGRLRLRRYAGRLGRAGRERRRGGQARRRRGRRRRCGGRLRGAAPRSAVRPGWRTAGRRPRRRRTAWR